MRIQKDLNLDGYDLNSVLAGNTLGVMDDLRAEMKRRALEGDETAQETERLLFGPWEADDEN